MVISDELNFSIVTNLIFSSDEFFSDTVTNLILLSEESKELFLTE